MESVWRALSSPHRRQVLDLLREGPKTIGQLTTELAGLSRFAVKQHVEVLESAHLALSRREGRQRLVFSNPVPIKEAMERWLSDHATATADSALHLRRYVESQNQKEKEPMNTPVQTERFRVLKLEAESVVKAPPHSVYDAALNQIDAWWPHRFKPDSKVHCDARCGGVIEEQFTQGGSALYGVVVWLEPGYKFAASSPSCMNKSFQSFSVETFESHPEGTLHRKSMTLTGEIPEGIEQSFSEAMKTSIMGSLRDFCETGKTYTPEAN